MEQIINLTQHAATADQVAAGVVELQQKEELFGLLTFDELPSEEEINDRAARIAALASSEVDRLSENGVECGSVMIGGAGWLLSSLEYYLKDMGLKPMYAFAKRVSVDTKKEDGSVVKTAVFKHLGFVEV